MSDPLEVVDLTRPHGFLVWRGKQQAIASPTPLPVGDVMITSDGEAFGVATLGQPAQMALSEFEREEGKHCIRPEERQLLWPKVEAFYVHSIKAWKGFNEPQPIADDYEPTDEEAGLIEKGRRLPKTIIIDPEAVTLTEGGFMVREEAKGNELSILLEATFGSSELTESEGEKALPLYSLALVRRPTLRYVKKKEVTEMPYKIDDNECVVNSDTGEVEKCHDTHEEAMAHLAALNINVEEKAGRRLAGSWRDKLRAAKDALMELVNWAEYADQVEEEESMADMLKGDSGVAIKMVSGEPWHLSWSSNAFQDRDEEIFSLKSLEQYVQENEENEVKGWFNLWHIKGTDFAEKRYQAIIGKFLFEAGPYLKDEKGRKALEFFKQYSAGHPEIAPEGWGASVEYKYLPEERKSKVYQWTWITRTSTLARGAAANIWTKSTQQEFMMNDEQRKAAVVMFGEEFTNQLISQGMQKTKELEEAGVASKQATEPEKPVETAPTPEPVPATETPTPEPVPAEVPVAQPQADPAKLVQELAVTMQANLNEAIAPVLSGFQQQLTVLGEQFKALSEELKQVKGEQALKASVEMPRFTFDLIRASQAKSTEVTEGDALKDKKPTEAAPTPNGGSVVQNYFPSAKG